MSWVKSILGYNDVSDDSDYESDTTQIEAYEKALKQLQTESKVLKDSLVKSENEKDEAVTHCVKEIQKLTKENRELKKKMERLTKDEKTARKGWTKQYQKTKLLKTDIKFLSELIIASGCCNEKGIIEMLGYNPEIEHVITPNKKRKHK